MKQYKVQEYISSGGTICPYCGGEELQGSSVEIENGKAFQQIRCQDCDRTWEDMYILSNIVSLVEQD